MQNISIHLKTIVLLIVYLITNDINAQQTDNTNLSINKNQKFAYKKIGISINAVYAFRYAIDGNISQNDQINDLSKQAKQNLGWCVDAHLALDEECKYYVGFQYGMIQSNCGVNSTSYSSINRSKNYFGDLTLNTNIKYWGINSMIAVAKIDAKRCFYFTFGINNMNYNEDLSIENYQAKAKQSAIGISYGFKYDKRINRNLGITTGLVMDKGLLSSVYIEENGVGKWYDFKQGDEYSLARLTFSFGAKFYFGSKKKEIIL